MQLVRDVLDKKIVDCNDREMGRVDGMLIEFPDDGQPRMIRLEMGGEILAARVADWLVPVARWLRSVWGPRRQPVVGIDWKHVINVERDLHLDIEADETEALAWEHWLAKNVVGRIPGSGA